MKISYDRIPEGVLITTQSLISNHQLLLMQLDEIANFSIWINEYFDKEYEELCLTSHQNKEDRCTKTNPN